MQVAEKNQFEKAFFHVGVCVRVFLFFCVIYVLYAFSIYVFLTFNLFHNHFSFSRMWCRVFAFVNQKRWQIFCFKLLKYLSATHIICLFSDTRNGFFGGIWKLICNLEGYAGTCCARYRLAQAESIRSKIFEFCFQSASKCRTNVRLLLKIVLVLRRTIVLLSVLCYPWGNRCFAFGFCFCGLPCLSFLNPLLVLSICLFWL